MLAPQADTATASGPIAVRIAQRFEESRVAISVK
jgi:hypothetical protein